MQMSNIKSTAHCFSFTKINKRGRLIMLYNGHDVKKRRDLGWRRARPEDLNSRGEPMGENILNGYYIVPVRIKDCRLNDDNTYSPLWIDDDGEQHIAPALPVVHIATNECYSKRRTRTVSYRGKYLVDNDGERRWFEEGTKYTTATFYVIYNGYVYSGEATARVIKNES